jgi:hypothetical protein
VCNSLANSEVEMGKLNYFGESALELSAQESKGVASAAIASSAFASVGASGVSGVSLINLIQLIEYLLYLNVQLPANVKALLQLFSFDLFSQINSKLQVRYNEEEEEYSRVMSRVPEKYRD